MDTISKKKIAKSIDNEVAKLTIKSNDSEPDIVVKLAKSLPDIIRNSLAASSVGMKYTVASSFIHKSPIVEFSMDTMGTGRCELGDILIVYNEKRNNEDQYNAMLMQAKMLDGDSSLSSVDSDQFYLYSKWPKFKYLSPSKLSCLGKRSITPKAITQGAQYLLIDKPKVKSASKTELWGASVNKPLTKSVGFGRMIVEMMDFEMGRTFRKASNMDGWSRMIVDLFTGLSPFKLISSGYDKESRWTGDVVLSLYNTKDEPLCAPVESEEEGFLIIAIQGTDEL